MFWSFFDMVLLFAKSHYVVVVTRCWIAEYTVKSHGVVVLMPQGVVVFYATTCFSCYVAKCCSSYATGYCDCYMSLCVVVLLQFATTTYCISYQVLLLAPARLSLLIRCTKNAGLNKYEFK